MGIGGLRQFDCALHVSNGGYRVRLPGGRRPRRLRRLSRIQPRPLIGFQRRAHMPRRSLCGRERRACGGRLADLVRVGGGDRAHDAGVGGARPLRVALGRRVRLHAQRRARLAQLCNTRGSLIRVLNLLLYTFFQMLSILL